MKIIIIKIWGYFLLNFSCPGKYTWNDFEHGIGADLTVYPVLAASSLGGLSQLTRLFICKMGIKYILYYIGRLWGFDEVKHGKPLAQGWNMAIPRKQKGYYYFFNYCHHQHCWLSFTSWALPVISEVPKSEWSLEICSQKLAWTPARPRDLHCTPQAHESKTTLP